MTFIQCNVNYKRKMFQCTLLANSFSIDESTRKNDVRIRD